MPPGTVSHGGLRLCDELRRPCMWLAGAVARRTGIHHQDRAGGPGEVQGCGQPRGASADDRCVVPTHGPRLEPALAVHLRTLLFVGNRSHDEPRGGHDSDGHRRCARTGRTPARETPLHDPGAASSENRSLGVVAHLRGSRQFRAGPLGWLPASPSLNPAGGRDRIRARRRSPARDARDYSCGLHARSRRESGPGSPPRTGARR